MPDSQVATMPLRRVLAMRVKICTSATVPPPLLITPTAAPTKRLNRVTFM